jgi:hypothetical protein
MNDLCPGPVRALVLHRTPRCPPAARSARELQRGLDADERRFLLSLVAGAPEWPLLRIAHLEHRPGLRWKLRNLAQLQKANPRKFAE